MHDTDFLFSGFLLADRKLALTTINTPRWSTDSIYRSLIP